VYTMMTTTNSRRQDASFPCEIETECASLGRRQISAETQTRYWADKGISGSPVFIDNGEQLVGIVTQSEVGANQDRTHLREGYIIAASAILPQFLDFRKIRATESERIMSELALEDVPIIDAKPITQFA